MRTHQIETGNQVAGGMLKSTDIRMFRLQYQELFDKLNLHQKCTVEAKKLGNWFILKGQVDSQQTKSKLFRLVPQIDGAQWIVDHIHIGKTR